MSNITNEAPAVSIIDTAIKEIKSGASQYYFYVPNTQAAPCGSVAYIYDMVKALTEKGVLATILHEEKYEIPLWMGESFKRLKHISFEQLKIRASDFLFLPEVYVHPFLKDMQKSDTKLPCEIVVISQFHDLIYYSLDIGFKWTSLGIKNVITTTQKQANFIEQSMKGLNLFVVNPQINGAFQKSNKPQKPFISMMARDKNDAEKLVKEFWNTYPHYSWIPFKFVTGMYREKMATELSECCLAVWIDVPSSFGTYPLECMKSGVPVIGLIPSMIPEWMETVTPEEKYFVDNGVWVSSKLSIPEKIARFIDGWLTDSIPNEIYQSMDETLENYTPEKYNIQLNETFQGLKEARIEKLISIQEKEKHNHNIKNINDAK